MPTLYLTEDRALVRRDTEDCLLVQIPERRGKDGLAPTPARSERIPLAKVDDVVVMGEVTMTASALHLLLDRNIEINFLSHYGKFKGRLSPPFSKNALLRQGQHRAHTDMSKRCQLARQFVIGKLSNQRQRLQRYNRSQANPEVRQVIERIADLLSQLAALPLDKVEMGKPLVGGDQGIEGTPLEAILGIEGAGSAAYFSCFGKLIEEFRPVIVDSVVLNLLNQRMLTSDDFVVELGAFRLKEQRRKVFFTQFEERLNEEVTHPIFGYKVKYRRCIELQVRLLAKFLTGEIDVYPPFLVR